MNWRAALLVLAAGVTAFIGACNGANERPRATQSPQDRTDIVDEQLLVALAQVKNFHHLADVHLADGDFDAAVAAVKAILEVPFPDAEERDFVFLEAYARLGTIELARGAFDQAQTYVEEGLAAEIPDSYFRANLIMVLGEIHKARGDSLATTDPIWARAEGFLGLFAFERGMQMNETLQKRLQEETQ